MSDKKFLENLSARHRKNAVPLWYYQFCEQKPRMNLRGIFWAGLLLGGVAGISYLFWIKV